MIKMASDKFILMGLNDEKAGHIAEVLKNKTCKKILDYLAEIKEASEKDMSRVLEIPINTVEYNLKKLVKSGLVVKAKNFFWSVKGRKISMYKLARKHIIISPNKRPSLGALKGVLPVIFIAVILIAIIGLSLFPNEGVLVDQTKMKQFGSQQELNNFIEQNLELNKHLTYDSGWFGGVRTFAKSAQASADVATGAGSKSSSEASDYSTTNIQVEGVDEADIVKNDGKYIYVVSGNKVVIVNAYPAEDMEILSEIKFEKWISEIFINDDKLIIFSYETIYIYDVSDRGVPELEDEIDFEGNYVNSRMIGDYVYVISNKYVNTANPEPPVYRVNGVEEKVSAGEVYYFPYSDANYVFTSVSAINVETSDFDNKVYLTGRASVIYVSQNNIYLSYQKRIDYGNYAEEMAKEVYLPVLPGKYDDEIKKVLDSDEDNWKKLNEMQNIVNEYSVSLDGDDLADFSEELMEKLEDFEIKIQKKMEKTIVHKINIDKGDIEYLGVGEVPGRILNQFSMDEYDGYFRIATTVGGRSWVGRAKSSNNLYVLNSDLEIVGKIEDLAEGESIYSARFMGKRAYIVTFKKIDPLFVIDLSEPESPEVLGYLKITGYSNYLHAYDENHVIGIGKETRGGGEDFSWYQGVKISLFDVSDVENPVEKAKIEIGDRGTDSFALYEHKAFLFDREKNLLVVPISLAEVNESEYEKEIPDSAYGKQVWQGAYVLDINLDEISVRGKITHDDSEEGKERYYYAGPYAVQRSLYMDDVLYTISKKMVRANGLESLDEINSVDFGYEEDYYGYRVFEESVGV